MFAAAAVGHLPHPPPSFPRIADPELRSRIVGYLATASTAGNGWCTDGTWIWPQSLAESVRTRGVGLESDLFDWLRQCGWLPAEPVSPAVQAQAEAVAAGSPPNPPAGHPEVSHFAVVGPTDRTSTMLRVITDAGASRSQWLDPSGRWCDCGDRDPGTGGGLVALTEAAAAECLDELCAQWHQRAIREGQESVADPAHPGPLVARVFDGEGPQGQPWFSPNRLRLTERARRERLAAFLAGGRLVVRAIGRVGDPLNPGAGAALPLSWRTDGDWVWQEALAYYVRVRGVAPELPLLCHIEERGYRLPPDLDPEHIEAARASVRALRPQRLERPAVSYLRSEENVNVTGSSVLLRRRGNGPTEASLELLGDDLRWHRAGRFCPASQRLTDNAGSASPISEAEAVRFIDARWQQLAEH